MPTMVLIVTLERAVTGPRAGTEKPRTHMRVPPYPKPRRRFSSYGYYGYGATTGTGTERVIRNGSPCTHTAPYP